MWPGLALNLLIQHPEHSLALHQHLQSNLLLRVCQDAVKTFHLAELGLFAPVPGSLELADGLVQEGDKELHGGELGSVRVHPQAVHVLVTSI